jgi:predicted dehydrogenase
MDPPLEYLPRVPRRMDFRIGCAGAGFIMRDCHLVAYRQAGFNPVAIASRNPERARACAAQHGVPRVHPTYGDLLADPQVEVLDVAVPPDAQPGLIREAVRHNDHIRGILAQKPLAMSVREARECVDLCAAAGVVLAVNQNMRYDQSVRAMKDLLRRGWLGDPVLATIEMRAIPHWMPWSEGLASLSTFVMSIHHLDAFRYWFGTPDRVLASTRPDPRTRFPHRDGINLYILEYDDGRRAAAWDDVWTGPSKEGGAGDISIRWRVEGTQGMARGMIGWPTYPARTPSTLDYTTRREPGVWVQPRWPEVWFPDAFVGTMAQLLSALEDGAEPEISGRDNLETVALCEAVFAAATEHRATAVREFLV